MSLTERTFTLAFAALLGSYLACADHYDFSIAGWAFTRDLPGAASTAADIWLASYSFFLLICGAVFVGLVIRDVFSREYLSPGHQLAWMVACTAFLPALLVYVLLHAWWSRERAGIAVGTLAERVRRSCAPTLFAFCSRLTSRR